jgi:hypothetical protein
MYPPGADTRVRPWERINYARAPHAPDRLVDYG